MKNQKTTIYTVSPLEKSVWTVICLLFIGFMMVPLILMCTGEMEAVWYGICGLIVSEISLFYIIFLNFFRRIVFDEERGLLKLCHFRVREIPIQDIKIVKRDEFIYYNKAVRYCNIYVMLIEGTQKTIELAVPLIGGKLWLEYTDEEIKRLNKRIDEWYMEYRKKNKKR